MLHVNYFMAIDLVGHWLIGRTDGQLQGFKRSCLPNGKTGRIIIAPARFIESFRSDWIFKHSWGAHQMLDKQTSLWLTKQAMLAWEDHRKVSLLS